MGEFFRARLFSATAFPELIDVKEAAELCLVSPDRLMKLAKDGIAPCVIVDSEKYLFFKKDVTAWAKENLIKIQDGSKLEVNLKFLAPAEVYSGEPPMELSALKGKLHQIPVHDIGPCVYFLVLREEVVYVGQSVNLLSRLATHQFDKLFDRVFFINVPAESILEIEAALIKKFKPKYNKTFPSDIHQEIHRKALEIVGM